MTPTTRVPCSNAANIGDRNSVPAQETAKHRAKFSWLPFSDVATVTKPKRETVEICWGAPNNRTDLSRQWAKVRHIMKTAGEILTFSMP